MDDANVPIFAQAKLEYTKQLIDLLYMNMYDGIRSIYDDSKRLYAQKTTSIIYIFRSLLENVPKWNSEIIESETARIIKTSKCDWLDDLLTAVFISHTRILMSIGPNQNYNKINVTIPKTTTFIHKTYINIAREVWKNPYLFNENVPGYEYQRNMKQLEDMVKLTIEDTIRRQLPIKEILREHLETYDEPRQPTTQKPIDMKMIIDEIKKATDNHEVQQSTEEDIPPIDESSTDINFAKEEEESVAQEESVTQEVPISESPSNPPNLTTTPPLTPPLTPPTTPPTTPTPPTPTLTGPYQDSEDPDEDMIKKATQNIVLNDITEPVVEQTYDNTDILSPSPTGSNPTTGSDPTTTVTLTELMKDLQKPTSSIDTETKPIDTTSKPIDTTSKPVDPTSKPVDPTSKPVDPTSKPVDPTIKPVETGYKDTKTTLTSVIKIDDPFIPSLSGTTGTAGTTGSVDDSKPLSFTNLYPGLGKVEDITKSEGLVSTSTSTTPTPAIPVTTPTPTTKPSDVNASVMKEVISLDKTEEKVDDTETLDNFFKDVQQLSNPMEPIKEDTKYTLFEDAAEKDESK